MQGLQRHARLLGLHAKHAVGLRSQSTRSVFVVRGAAGEASGSGRDLECAAPRGFGALRKGFKPTQQKRTQKAPNTPKLNGRDKAEVMADARAEIASQLTAKSGNSGGGPTQADWIEDWKRSDAKVNTYPDTREFTAVGSGGDDFKVSMVKCVEDVVGGPVAVSVRDSSGGKYQSVRVGPVVVQNRDQVLAVFLKMREDKRLKFHL